MNRKLGLELYIRPGWPEPISNTRVVRREHVGKRRVLAFCHGPSVHFQQEQSHKQNSKIHTEFDPQNIGRIIAGAKCRTGKEDAADQVNFNILDLPQCNDQINLMPKVAVRA